MPFSSAQIRKRLLDQFNAWKGTGYRSGGMSRRGIDCSGFVYITFRDRLGVRLPRTTAHLARAGKRISRAAMAPGDLVLFKTGWYGRHVGIYVGDFRFIHVSKSEGVTVSSLHNDYWARQFWMARRVASPAGSGGG
ncbi:MAG: C40 family peptidase, partial [Deltaproteobacteria bacterium]|nr:C40 family peptidase [Deltaproteobacteria bacterium]